MQRTGTANLPLHGGKAPRWLFQRMVRLSGGILDYMVEELGPGETLVRFSDPFWFQSLGCVLGFDWHSSGVTTTTCGAVKEALRGRSDLSLFACGGKGATSRRTPQEIEEHAEKIGLSSAAPDLVKASRMSAKVDSNALQDGYQIYHHFFIFTADGEWTVVQQGMNETNRYARRYHWLGEAVSSFTCEPHAGICAGQAGKDVLNMVAQEGEEARKASALIGQEHPETLVKELKKIKTLRLPARHEILAQDLHPDRLYKIFIKTYEAQPKDFENLIGLRGVGPKGIRALALLSELIYGASVSFRDPARFSFAHGGKDGYPYPVDRRSYDRSIEILRQAVEGAKIGDRERIDAIRRLKGIQRRTR